MAKHIFVTVGTTKFEELIETLSQKDIISLLKNLGYTSIQFQTGVGNYKKQHYEDFTLNYTSYFENFEEEINRADLIISHAGAGTCLQVLRKQKPLIVVINENLMDNHQTELAKQLAQEQYLLYCSCNTLKYVLKESLSQLQPYPKVENQAFSNYLDKCMGFI